MTEMTLLVSLTIAFSLVTFGAITLFVKYKKMQSLSDQNQHETLSQMLEKIDQKQSELQGRLSNIMENTSQSHNQLQTKLFDQEKNLHKTLDEKLLNISKTVYETLEKSNNNTSNLMSDMKSRLTKIDEAQKNITNLSGQMVELQNILNNKQARGAFGEVQLQNLVETLLPPTAYELQATLSSQDNTPRRVDCLLRLPNPPGNISIDAKFPLEGFYALSEAKTNQEKAEALRFFSTSVDKHLKDISHKYIIPGKTSDSALMFIPSETVYSEIHAQLPKIVEKSYQLKVFMVSPTTLWATLNTIRGVLRNAQMQEQAEIIQTYVQKLTNDIARLDQRVHSLQRHFDQANEDIRQIKISSDKISKTSETIENIEIETESQNISHQNTRAKLAS